MTDSHKSYKKLASFLILHHMEIPSGKRKINNFSLQKTNSLHSKIKSFMFTYRGVSTKYLQNYLSLFKFIDNRKGDSPLFIKGKSPYKNKNFKGRLPLYS